VDHNAIQPERLELLMQSERLEATKSRSLLSAVIWGFFAAVFSVVWLLILPTFPRGSRYIVVGAIALAASILMSVRHARMYRAAAFALRVCEETLRHPT
jgi:hypothetical protein